MIKEITVTSYPHLCLKSPIFLFISWSEHRLSIGHFYFYINLSGAKRKWFTIYCMFSFFPIIET